MWVGGTWGAVVRDDLRVSLNGRSLWHWASMLPLLTMTGSCLCHIMPWLSHLYQNPRLWTKPFCFQEFKMLDGSKLGLWPWSHFVFLANQGHVSADFNRASRVPWATEVRIRQRLGSLRKTGTGGLRNVNWNKACAKGRRVTHVRSSEQRGAGPGV